MDILAKLTEEIAARRKKLEALENDIPKAAPFRYVVDFKFPYVEIRPALTRPTDEMVQTFTVKKDTKFYLKAIEIAYTASGPTPVFAGPDISISPTLPNQYRSQVFDFQWKVRDTGSDREWQNDFLPSAMLLSGNKTGLQFFRGHSFLSGGSEVYVTMGPVFHYNGALGVDLGKYTGLSSIVEANLQVSFIGVGVQE